MATELRLRRGTTAEHATFTGALAEVTVDTTKKALVVHDGFTPGGFPVTADVAASVHAATEKTSPAPTDEVGIADSAASWGLKRLTLANLRTWLAETFFAKAGGNISGNVNLPSLNGGQLAGFRNKIINGNFDIWQRGTSLTTSSNFPSGAYIADRFLSAADATSSGSITVSRQAFTPGQTDVPYEPTYFYRMSTSSFANGANGFTYLAQQRIENVRTFAGQTVTLSFYARASVAANICVSMNQTFGTGGSGSVIFGTQVLALTTTFQKFTRTFTVPSIAGKTIGDNSYLALEIFSAIRGTTATAYGVPEFSVIPSGSYDIAQVQLEVGPVATPFEHRPYGLELALCRRYLPVVSGPTAVGSGWCISGTQCYVEVPHQVSPRVPPTGITVTAASGFNLYSSLAASLPCTSVAFNSGGTLMSRLSVQVASGLAQGQATGMFATTSNEKIIFTGCEL